MKLSLLFSFLLLGAVVLLTVALTPKAELPRSLEPRFQGSDTPATPENHTPDRVETSPESVVLMQPVTVTAPNLSDLPGFKGYRADPYIAAAAALQAIGKEKATAPLCELARDRDWYKLRAVLLCRMLFVAKKGKEFRRPSVGAPLFLSWVSLKDGEACLEQWPLEPLEIVDGVPFVVVYNYRICGFPEWASDYVHYCLENCDWNSAPFKPKSAKVKMDALEKLLASPKWTAPVSDEAKQALRSQIE